MYNILLKCRNHPLFAAIIVISADPLISKWLKQSRARFSDGNRIGARGHAGGYWREWQFENNYKHFQNYIEQNDAWRLEFLSPSILTLTIVLPSAEYVHKIYLENK